MQSQPPSTDSAESQQPIRMRTLAELRDDIQQNIQQLGTAIEEYDNLRKAADLVRVSLPDDRGEMPWNFAEMDLW